MFEGDGLLDIAFLAAGGVHGEVLAVEVGKAVVLPEHGAGHGLATEDEPGREGCGGQAALH